MRASIGRWWLSWRATVVVALVVLLVAGLGGVALAKVIEGNNRPNTLVGTNQSDTLRGKGKNDDLCGDNGDDTYFGGRGPDLLVEFCTNNDPTGNDEMHGGPGTDAIIAGRGRDRIDAGDGHDIIGKGLRAVIVLFGDDGDDRIRGGKGSDGMSGDDGEDELFGEDGDDVLDAISDESSPQADLVDGGRGHDLCIVDTLDVVRNCERVIEFDAAARQLPADIVVSEAEARAAFEAKYGTSE
jgi:Ca2+-binding RTX toxin-like protein